MEFVLHDDPKTYVAKPLFGKFSPRSMLTWTLVIGFCIPISLIGYMYHLNDNFTFVCLLIAGVPPIVIGQYKREGLYMEQFLPLWWSRFNTPLHSYAYPPKIKVDVPVVSCSRRELRAQAREERKDKRQRKHDMKSAQEFVTNFAHNYSK